MGTEEGRGLKTDRLGSIIAFVRVAELGSFAAAGRSLGVSASAVSKSVMRLEQRLGLRLFQRTTRSLALTEDGQAFMERCGAIVRQLDEAERDMRERAARPSGLLRVEVPVALGRLKIVPALSRLTALHPDLRIEVSFADTLTDPIAAGLDAVVRIGFPRDPRLMVRRVGTLRFIVCAAPSYLAAHGAPLTVDDLDRHDCIRRVQHERSGYAPWRFSHPETGVPFECEVKGTLHFGSNDAIVDAGLAGAGLVQLHTYMAEPHLKSGALVQVLADYSVAAAPISVLFPSSLHLAPKVRAFIELVASVLEADSGFQNAR
jgi:LysR family transcriptional regulator, regulator for bpeEF and oprC